MIDHISLNVRDLRASRDFYQAALKAFGYDVIYDIEDVANFNMGVTGCSFGENKETRLWLSGDGEVVKTHIAFRAQSKEEVNAFYDAAIAAGGKDNGKPGPRERYSPDYYGAFVLDPDGNNIEAVYRGQ